MFLKQPRPTEVPETPSHMLLQLLPSPYVITAFAFGFGLLQKGLDESDSGLKTCCLEAKTEYLSPDPARVIPVRVIDATPANPVRPRPRRVGMSGFWTRQVGFRLAFDLLWFRRRRESRAKAAEETLKTCRRHT